ncbi:hypothetical protein ACQEU3_43210 [Spirillospora sp. CA-253888]
MITVDARACGRLLLRLLVLTAAVSYCAVVVIFNAPDSPGRTRLVSLADQWFSPAFSQSWKLFSNPPTARWRTTLQGRGPGGLSAEADLADRLEHPLPQRLISHSKVWQLGKCHYVHALGVAPPRGGDLSRRIADSHCRDELLAHADLHGLQNPYDRLFTALALERFPGRHLTHFRIRIHQTPVPPPEGRAERRPDGKPAFDSGWRPIVPGVVR